MKMRGNPTPEPSHSPDVAGLLRWLRHSPSQWSALGWQNAPAWADAIGDLVAFVEKERDEAIADRDEARRWVCRLLANPTLATGSAKPYRGTAQCFAIEQGWDCFRNDDENEVTP